MKRTEAGARTVPLETFDPAHDWWARRDRGRHGDDYLAGIRHLDDRPLRRFEDVEALVRPRSGATLDFPPICLEHRVHDPVPSGRRTILHARPSRAARTPLEALERKLGRDERPEIDDSVLEEPPGRAYHRLPDLAPVDGRDRQILEDERLGDADRGGLRMGSRKRTTFPPWRTISNASWIAFSAPDISKTTPSPSPSFCSTNQAATSSVSSTLTTASVEPPSELELERHVVGCEQTPGAERAGDRRRARPARSRGRQRRGRRALGARREDGVPERLLEARDLRRELRAVVAPDDGRAEPRRTAKPRRDRRRRFASARTCAPGPCGSGSRCHM